MGRWSIWAARGALAAVMFMAGVGPDAAKSNISAWLDLAGWERGAAATADWTIDPALIWVCFLLLLLSFVPNIIETLAKHGVLRPRPLPRDELKRVASEFRRASANILSSNVGNSSSYYRPNLLGDAALITFRKHGFATPIEFDDDITKNYAMLQYFEELLPLIDAGHIGEARKKSKRLIGSGKFQWEKMSQIASTPC